VVFSGLIRFRFVLEAGGLEMIALIRDKKRVNKKGEEKEIERKKRAPISNFVLYHTESVKKFSFEIIENNEMDR